MKKIKKTRKSTLNRQFVSRMLIVLLIILSSSGFIQYLYLSKKVNSDVTVEAYKVAQSIEQGLIETHEASKAIELQLDLKLKLIAQHISDRLGDRPITEITNEELVALSKEFNIAGISLFEEQAEGDIVGVKSTARSDIGFSFKKFLGEESHGYQTVYKLLKGEEIDVTYETYVDETTVVLPIAPSGSHNDTPTFFKYGYYVAPDKNYIINPFFEANEVYHFTQDVGPSAWIKTVLESNDYVEEVAVLTPEVYADPSLLDITTELWKKIEYGAFDSETEKDRATVSSFLEKPERVSYIEKQGEKTYYKMFIPTDDGKVIYVGLDYDHMSAPLKNMSLILLGFSFISLLALFILSTRFFGKIYKNIQVIISQIKTLESGDFTSQSEIKDNGELGDLSASANRMTVTLKDVLKDTTKQASKVQTLSSQLNNEANETVEKVYEISIDLTSKARDDAFEIMDFLDMVEKTLQSVSKTEDVESLLNRIEKVRALTNDRSQSATEITITLSDLIKSLQEQSMELSEISNVLFKNMYKFKLK
ncbi:hypothetical protein CD30_12430 [Ureibacillus massiliensis 4400831 = CIP 108448 = CCUG 49529]|uniref:HAMP domain-containing protein n=1 Tax=Ureibacillus massiliensis 4400831 = CIP 108448 = CCUG 49529 TaxID=1211035 RepID=A0A0A3IZU6_9BACL|nr:methyl-accepting chemotaxis protein [Ureibacillus massiliensis]KGR90269.1 hypothetical protein CD30_12430 [Ureibacillus massiliensis 4400831 = CIP 108448 = CCUG 49529]